MSKNLPVSTTIYPFVKEDVSTKKLSSPLIDVRISQSPQKTFITVKFLVSFFNTNAIPQTLFFLETHFPPVLDTKCFNDQNLPFIEEVKITELGHLFEHILIRKIYDLRVAGGEESIVIEGRTEWDWTKEDRGVFNIVISSGKNNSHFFTQGLKETISLMENLILTSTLNN